MPHRRKPQKGSFGGHFDELVNHFPDHRALKPTDRNGESSKEERSIHVLLFERASELESNDGARED